MGRSLRDILILNGTLVALAGLLAGFPFALAITGDITAEPRAWRMAHLEGLLNGMLLLAVAGVYRRLRLEEGQRKIMVWSLAAMAWANFAASVIGAIFGERGLTPALPPANLVVYSLFFAAVVGVFAGLGLVVYGVVRGREGN